MPSRRTTEIPFSINRDDARTLLAQVADGLRDAIVAGRYAPGDVVPSSRALASRLGVSHIVTEAALKRLAEEGFIVARPRAGCVVRDRSTKKWRGHVALVRNSLNMGYFQATMSETLRNSLNEAGYLFTLTAATYDAATGRSDLSPIDAALARSVDLILVMSSWDKLITHLARQGKPLAFISYDPSATVGVGATLFDNSAAIGDLGAAASACGFREAVVMDYYHDKSIAEDILPSADIKTSRLTLGPIVNGASLMDIEQTGFEGFRRLIGKGRINRNTLYYFEDDYLARGAMMAMALAGLHAPEDIRFATLANAGFLPAYERELTRIEIDPVEAGKLVAADALAFLRTGHYPDGSAACYRFIRGETMGNAECTMQNAQCRMP
jgi:DNA-binding transcriptional regulator YhcF (GntR family)